jgi:hypothetical protein
MHVLPLGLAMTSTVRGDASLARERIGAIGAGADRGS